MSLCISNLEHRYFNLNMFTLNGVIKLQHFVGSVNRLTYLRVEFVRSKGINEFSLYMGRIRKVEICLPHSSIASQVTWRKQSWYNRHLNTCNTHTSTHAQTLLNNGNTWAAFSGEYSQMLYYNRIIVLLVRYVVYFLYLKN